MKKSIFLFFLLISIPAFSQLAMGTSFGKFRVGGGLSMSFGNDSFFGVSVYPSVGYMLMPGLEAGVTVGYQYSGWKTAKSNLFSAGPYLQFFPIDELFLRSHYEYFTGKTKFKDNSYSINYDESALWLGGGYRSGGKVSFYAGLEYNVLWKKDESIFSNAYRPIVGVSIGL